MDDRCKDICEQAAGLVSGERALQHGSKRENLGNIAAFWSEWLSRNHQLEICLSAHDVAVMMELLKIARRLSGSFNLDDYVDGVGYCAIAGQLAEEDHATIAERINHMRDNEGLWKSTSGLRTGPFDHLNDPTGLSSNQD